MNTLRTVRVKLAALVVASAAVMVAALPVLAWLLQGQLVEEADSRVSAAQGAFETELDDDLADLTLASRVLAADEGTARALASRDADALRRLGRTFVDIYPEIDALFVSPDGEVLAQVGCDNPPMRVEALAGVAHYGSGQSFRGVVEHGCESPDSDRPPAYVIGVPVSHAGAVVVCLPLDTEYVKNSSAKLGVELALAWRPAGRDERLVGRTSRFPVVAAGAPSSKATLRDAGREVWAIARFEPGSLAGAGGRLAVASALDVTDVRRIVRRHIVYALAVLALASAASVAMGSRIAASMSEAIHRIHRALSRVEQLDYVHVEPLRTGDELEELARGFNRMVDGLRERDKLRATFGKYMTETVMDHLLAGKVELGGESIRVTILFTDIRGFTTISERMEPHGLVALLNEYFTEMVGIVMQEGGVVDKYIGDAIMAVFGAPVPRAGDAANAVRAAVRMRAALRALNARLEARGLPALRTGIGIHTGEVVAGNIGSEKRMEYTVIGDAVNVASRLETSTKDLGADVLISEDTYALTRDIIESRPVGPVHVKGRLQPVGTYEVLRLRA